MIPPLVSALRRTAGIATRRPRTGAWTVLALASALVLAGAAVIAADGIERWADAHPPGGGHLVLYLGDGVDEARAQALVRELATLRGVQRAELVSADESARRLARALGPDPALLEGVDPASLPASIEVALAPGVREVVAMSPTVRALRDAPGVAELVVEDGADDRLPAVLEAARAIAWPAAAALAALAMIAGLAAVRVRLERPVREAAVLALLGAPPGFVAIPSALAGGLLGTLAGGIAALALEVALELRPGWLAMVALAPPGVAVLAGLFALGALIGLVGGALAGVARAR